MRKLFTLLAAVALLWGQLAAQNNRTVTGKVTDDKGMALVGVTVSASGSSAKTLTNAEGNFSLQISDKVKSLEFSYIGFGVKQMAIGGKSVLNVSMSPEDRSLSEVVVVGYGTKPVREVTGAISKIAGERISNEPITSFNQGLAGKTAGVQVNLSTGLLADRTAIRIRGVNSISSSTQPLIVVDGIPQLNTTNLNGFNGGNGNRFDPLALINAADIESVEVLKDAGAAVIFGSRASNGVILVTTKKGKKGTMKVSFDSKVSWSTPTKNADLLNGDEFITISNEKTTNRFATSNPTLTTPAKNSDVDGDGINDRTNWNDLLYRSALMTDNSVSFQGGSDKISVYGSLRYLNQEGIVLINQLKSGQGRLNLDITPKSWFKAGLQLAYNRTMVRGVLSDTYITGTTVSGWMAPPTVSAYNPAHITGFNLTSAGLLGLGNNTPVAPGGGTLLPSTAYFYNVLAALNLNRNDNLAQDTRVNIYGTVLPVKGLAITTKFGVQYQNNLEDQYTAPYIAGLGIPYNGLVQNQIQDWQNWVWQNYATYDKTFAAKHKVSLTGGAEYQRSRYKYWYIGANNFSDPFFKEIIDGAYTNTLPNSTTILNLTGGNNSQSSLISYFGRFNYIFDNKYFIELGFRRDGYSAFGKDNQFGNFPSVSAGWEVTKESFMNNVKWLNYLKIRGSIGTVGNSRIADFAARTLYSGASYTSLTGLGISQVANSALQWESAKKTNIGFDATVLKNKLSLTIDYFINDVDKLILSAPTLYTVGIPGSTISTNIGGLKNSGVEITINATPVQTRNFTWSTSFNFTTIKNKVTGLVPSNGNVDIVSGVQVASMNRPLSEYFLPNWAGVNPANGNPMWYAANGSIKMWDFATQSWKDDKGAATTAVGAADYVYQNGKQGLPKWYGGFDNTFSYRSFDLNIALVYQGGNYIYNSSKAGMLTNFYSNNFREILDRWTAPGQVTDVPKLWAQDNTANIASTRFLEKGDYVRVRTITLGYNLSKSVLERMGLERMRFYVQAFNPFTFTNYSGLDPDVNYNSFSNIAIGTDNRATPQVKTMTLGLNVTF